MIRPLLAATVDPKKEPNVFSKLRFPLMASPKLDGIRALVYNYGVYSREGLLLPSLQVQRLFSQYDGLDGELIVDEPNTVNVYNRTQSAVMSQNKLANVTLHIIDRIGVNKPFIERYNDINEEFREPSLNLRIVPQYIVNNLGEFLHIEDQFLEDGYEGIMLRRPDGPYKYGRSTLNQHILMKLKRFEDIEVTVIGFVEQTTNTNAAKMSPLGYTERSSAKEGMVPAGTLGKFTIDYNGTALNIGCGAFNHRERQYIWDHQGMFLGKTLKMRYFGIGQDGYLPRHGRAVGWRNYGE